MLNSIHPSREHQYSFVDDSLLNPAVEPLLSLRHCPLLCPVLSQFVYEGAVGESVKGLSQDKQHSLHSPCSPS